MFKISNAARAYIEKKGGQVTVYAQALLTGGG